MFWLYIPCTINSISNYAAYLTTSTCFKFDLKSRVFIEAMTLHLFGAGSTITSITRLDDWDICISQEVQHGTCTQ